jgi:hypothetical protein
MKVSRILILVVGLGTAGVVAGEACGREDEVSAKAAAPEAVDFAAELRALNAGRGEADGARCIGEPQRALIERAVRSDPRAAAQVVLEQPELVMVGDYWLINAQALFRLWGAADLPAMAEWVGKHRLHPKLQPAADYALFQHRVDGLGEGEAIALWRGLPDATRHWASKDIAFIVALSDPGTALERLARLFSGGERGLMMSGAMDVVARKHPRTLLPWLAELAPFFYNEPQAADALCLLPASEVEATLAKLTAEARAQISLEYMRSCLSREEHERAKGLLSGVTVEPYKSLMEAELKSANQ